ncbi:MAG: class I SAM-dependent methyltransferase [Natronospirillum sp.]|uniref:SAM-dependent methyltransferase n=1 Tax=Natronospirillum sp. TaxID=2812955 RepID=UPI0025D2000A|nr:class I SAM-dependent methyltransferase [Natronospirillum sp.]MCH8551143.1 class I SAM-dependent methyltransferase [Natronospirillum sp.]
MMWNERYSTQEYAYGKEPNDFLRRTADDILPGDVLCIGEGEGRNAVFLAQLGFNVTAVDLSEVGLAKAQRLAAERGVTITTIQADLADYVIEPGRWSAIVSIFCHLPPEIRLPLHRKVVAGLQPGGTLVYESYHPEQIERATGGPSDPALLPDLGQLREELSGLNMQCMQEMERPVSEGIYHQGDSMVVQIMAFKPS